MACDLQPFLKWPGGKRWFVEKYWHLLPQKFNRYIEPFLGGGSVFFHLKPRQAILGDLNTDVVAAYQGYQLDWERLEGSLRYHARVHSATHYYDVRTRIPSDPIRLASRAIYLNRTCFNGIYRVNLRGKFNVPMGSKTSVLLDTDDFEATAAILSNADIRNADFQVLIDEARDGDLIFADPPYTVRHNYNGFIKYNEKLFSWSDQERLASALINAQKRGVQIVATNADHASVRELYKDNGFQLITVSRFSSISAAAASRKQFRELVILGRNNCHEGGKKNAAENATTSNSDSRKSNRRPKSVPR